MTDISTTEDMDPITPKVVPFEQPEDDPMFYFSAVVKVLYVRDGAPKERTVNVLVSLANPYITQKVNANISRAALNQVMQANNVTVDDLRETLLLNISLLGHMPPSIFNDMPEDDQSEQAD